MNHSAALPPELAAESRFQNLTRLGFAARGLLYIVIAILVIGTGRTEDLTGALEYLNKSSGRVLLVALALGLAAYGLWRLADAAFGMETTGNDGKAMRKRAAAALVGSIYLYLAYKAVRLLFADGGGTSEQQRMDSLLGLPGGNLVVGLAALVLAVAGGYQLYTAFSCSFLRKLDDRATEPLVKWLGRIGYAARGIIFLLVAFLVGRTAVNGRSNGTVGMEQALDLLSGPLLFAVAAGLMLFGVFSLVEARYRRIRRPPSVDQATDRVMEKLPG